jgi:DNA-binding NtrC family response regulator
MSPPSRNCRLVNLYQVLRERPEDIPLLARHLLQEAGTDKALSPEALAILQ